MLIFQETGDRRQETGDRRQEAGGRRQEAGGRRQETGISSLPTTLAYVDVVEGTNRDISPDSIHSANLTFEIA